MTTEEKRKELGEYLKYRKISPGDLMEMFGVSQPMISALLSGKKSFGKKTAAKWAEKLSINASWLLTGEGEMLKTDTKEPAPASDIIEIPREVFNQINGLIETVKSQQESIRSLTNVAESFSRIEEKIDSREGVVSKAGDVL